MLALHPITPEGILQSDWITGDQLNSKKTGWREQH